MARLLLRDNNTNWPRGQEFDNIQTGNVFYVDSATGADTSVADGSQEAPYASLDYAVGKCTANNGDVINLFPNHAETLASASAATLDVAGVTVLGLGNGDDRPTLTFGTTSTASLVVSAANVTIKNVLGVAGVDGLTNPFNIQAADCTLDIEWEDAAAAVEAARAVLTNASADNFNCKLRYRGQTGGDACVNAIRLVGCNGGRIDVDFYGVASTSIVEFHTTACTDIEVTGTFYNSGTTDLSKNVVDTVTGSTWWADGFDGAAAIAFSGGSGSGGAALEPSGGGAQSFVVTATMTSATWNSVASHEIATVTGLNRIKVTPYCTTNLVGGANAGSGTLTFGDASSASRLITATTASTIDANEIWVTSSTGHEKVVNYSATFDIVSESQDIGYTVGTSALTAGVLVFYVEYTPMESGAKVTAGAGGSL